MKAIAYHIRHRFFISKSDVRQSATFDPAQTKSADFPDRDFGGVRGDFTFPRGALHFRWAAAWRGSLSARIVGISYSLALKPDEP